MDGALGDRTPQVRPRLRLKVILVALVLCRGFVLLCVIPPFEGWDEFQHVAYIVHLSESGQRPILGTTIVPRSLQARLSTFPHGPYALKMLESTGAVDYGTFWERPIAATTTDADRPANRPMPLYQAQHGPFYYSLAAPLFAFAGGVGDLRMSMGVLRLVNLLLTAASVWIALGIVERLIRDRSLGGLCGLLIAMQPLFLINGVRVANDALGIFFATAAVAAALDRRTFGSRASTFSLGLLVGLATLAKSVHLGLIPFVLICAFVACVPDRVVRTPGRYSFRALGATLFVTGGFLLATFAEFRDNLSRYGTVTAMQESVQNGREGRGVTDLVRATGSVRWVKWARNLWLRKNVMAGGWSWAGDNESMQDWHELFFGIALAGWAWTLRPGRRSRRRGLYRPSRPSALPGVVRFLLGGPGLSHRAFATFVGDANDEPLVCGWCIPVVSIAGRRRGLWLASRPTSICLAAGHGFVLPEDRVFNGPGFDDVSLHSARRMEHCPGPPGVSSAPDFRHADGPRRHRRRARGVRTGDPGGLALDYP